MAGFESIVRPVVFPNIRPPAPGVLPAEDAPGQGVATISGSGGKLIDLSHSYSNSMSRSLPQKETQRTFDKERVYQEQEPDITVSKNASMKGKMQKGKINRNNYVDLERLKKVAMEDGTELQFADPPKADNIETLAIDQVRIVEK